MWAEPHRELAQREHVAMHGRQRSTVRFLRFVKTSYRGFRTSEFGNRAIGVVRHPNIGAIKGHASGVRANGEGPEHRTIGGA